MKVFLGGTCNETTWRDELEGKLRIDYFNPVVEDWDDEVYENELREKEECDIMLIHITPKMTGVFSIAEVVESALTKECITVFSYQVEDDGFKFDESQIKSLDRVGDMIEEYAVVIEYANMDNVSSVLNLLGMNQ